MKLSKCFFAVICFSISSCYHDNEAKLNTFKRDSKFILEKHSTKILELLNSPKRQDYFEQSIVRKFDTLDLPEDKKRQHIAAFMEKEQEKMKTVQDIGGEIIMAKAKKERELEESDSKYDGKIFVQNLMDSLYRAYNVHPIIITYFKGLSKDDALSVYLKEVVLPEIIKLKKEHSISDEEYNKFRSELDPRYSGSLAIN